MKYLKLFESVDKSYSKIPNISLPDYLYGKDYEDRSKFISENWMDFSNKDFTEIKKIFSSAKLIEENWGFKKDVFKQSILISKHIRIYKLSDEWYYLMLVMPDYDECYQCDQLDGLLDCLKHIKKLIDKLSSHEIFYMSPLHTYKGTRYLSESKYHSSDSFHHITYGEGFSSIFGGGLGYDIGHQRDIQKEFIQDNWVDFTQSEMDQLSHFFPNKYIKLNSQEKQVQPSKPISTVVRGHLLGPPGNEYPFIDINIYKLRDDWYYVKVTRTDGYYKCDQFDGLLECFEFLKTKKHLN